MKGRAWSVLAALAVVLATTLVVLGLGRVQTASGKPPAAASSGCGLANGIKHVIQIQFDNTHFLRDRPNVPSDLEQMPHLLNFIKGNGTLLTNDFRGLGPDGRLDPFSIVCKVVSANGRPAVKLSDNPMKAMGAPVELARYRRVFQLGEQAPLPVAV